MAGVTLRSVRAIAWLQWRLAANGMKGTRRDGTENASRIAQLVVRVLAVALGLPLLAGAMALGVWGGYAVSRGGDGAAIAPTILAFTMIALGVWLVIRPMTIASSGRLERAEMLRLLPIPERLLASLELFRALFDPFVLVLSAAVLALPLGALLGGRPLLALAALAAGLLAVAVGLGFAGLVSLLVQLLLRDRRRGELITLVFFLLLSVGGIVPQLFVDRDRPDRRSPATEQRTPAAEARETDELPAAVRLLPPAAYGLALLDASRGRTGWLALDLALLGGVATLAIGATQPLHRRLLRSPERAGPRQRSAALAWRRLPLLSGPASAVAAAEWRLVLRTVRGKMALLGAPLTALVLVLVATRSGASGFGLFAQPFAMAAFAAFLAIATVAQIACNQFALDRAGLVLELLAPLSARDLVIGKAVALGALAVTAGTLVVVPLAVVTRSSPALWLSAWLAVVGAAVVLSPVHALLAAVLPRTADLGSMGRSSQPHSLASLIAMVTQPLALAPAAAAVAVAFALLDRPWLAPPLVVGWIALAWLIARLLLPLPVRALTARRENLAMIAVGR